MEITIKKFEPIKPRFIALSDQETFDKECSFAIQHLQKNPYLQKSTDESLMRSVLNIVQIGLTLNPVQRLAYLVPRWNTANSVVECHLEPSYQGLVKLLTDSGSIINCYSYMIYENDFFEQKLGTENEIIHNPKLGQRGNPIGVYAVAVLSNGTKQVEVMDITEVDEIRDTSESWKSYKAGKAKSCIWESWYDEMARKTVIKRLIKYLPKSNYDKISNAINLIDEDYKISDSQINYINSLLHTSTFSPERVEFYDKYLNTLTPAQASKLIEELKNNQINPILHKGAGNQTQIKEQLSKL